MKKRELYPVYFKTGNQRLADDCRIEAIENCNYKVFNRRDVLTVLNEYKGCNAILWEESPPPRSFDGNLRCVGKGVPEDDAEAARWYRDAAGKRQLRTCFSTPFQDFEQ